MNKTCLKLLIIMVLAIVFGAPSCWAKEKGYCYIVSYGLREKSAYLTPVFTATVTGVTYSEEEFVADIELIGKMEAQFNKYLSGRGVNTAAYVTSARVAYRSRDIADKYLANEKKDFTGRGYTIKDTSGFQFKN